MEKLKLKIVSGYQLRDGIEETVSKEEAIKKIRNSEPGSEVSIYDPSGDCIFEADVVGFGRNNITSLVVYINDINFTEEELNLPIEEELWEP